jgi:hypothetical protein
MTRLDFHSLSIQTIEQQNCNTVQAVQVYCVLFETEKYIISIFVRFEVLTVAIIKTTFFWVVF